MGRSIIIKILFFVLCLSSTLSANAKLEVKINTHEKVYDTFIKWTSDTPVQLISKYNTGYFSNDEVIYLILLCKALYISENDVSLNIKPVLNYKRAFHNAKEGTIHIPARTFLKKRINRKVFFISQPIIDKDDHEKGIYSTIIKNKALCNINSLEQLKSYNAVILNEWGSEWDTLRKMKIRSIISVRKIDLLYEKLKMNKADFTILAFSKNNDFSIEYKKTLLIPIKNIKIGIKDSRHFIISKSAKKGLEVYQVLQKGIEILKKKGTINKALIESGIKDYRVKNWKMIF